MAPTISIVTPSYQQGQFIEQAIDSVCAQNYPGTEHIVFDGGSSDGTVDILRRRHNDLGLWVSERDNGQSHALNKGFQRATGEIVGWLNADDYYTSGTFSKVARVFSEHPEIDVIYGDYDWVDGHGALITHRKEIPFDLNILIFVFCYIPTTTTFFRRRLLNQVHGIDETLRYVMDLDFFIRLAISGARFYHLAETLAAFRWHGESKSQAQTDLQWKEWREILSRKRYPSLSIPNNNVLFYSRRLIHRTRRVMKKFQVGAYDLPRTLFFKRPY